MEVWQLKPQPLKTPSGLLLCCECAWLTLPLAAANPRILKQQERRLEAQRRDFYRAQEDQGEC